MPAPLVVRCRAAEVVFSYGGRGDEMKGKRKKEPSILDIVFVAVRIRACFSSAVSCASFQRNVEKKIPCGYMVV